MGFSDGIEFIAATAAPPTIPFQNCKIFLRTIISIAGKCRAVIVSGKGAAADGDGVGGSWLLNIT